MKLGARAALGASAGGVLALGAPPLQFWPAVFASVLLFAWATDGARPRDGAIAGWLMGTVATLGAFYWVVGTITRFTALPLAAGIAAYVLMSLAAGVTLGIAGALAATLEPVLGHAIALSLALFVSERFVPNVFPWQVASPLIFAPAIRQSADLVGVSGLGAILAGIAAMVVSMWRTDRARRSSRIALGAALALFAALWIYGGVRASIVRRAIGRADRVRIALIQPDIPPAIRWEDMFHAQILDDLRRQTYDAFQQHVELVVWSEGAYPYALPHRAGLDGEYSPPAYPWRAAAPIVVGAISRDDEGRRYNAAFIREIDGTLSEPVAKQVLVPFGEYVPLLHVIPWVRHTFARAEGLTPGTRSEILSTRFGLRIAILNCFEDTLAWVAARESDADFLVNITNDAWFGEGAAAWQHLMLARWRSIETGRELLRAVDTGVTGRVNVLGDLEEHLPIWQRGTLVVEARKMKLRPLAPAFIRVGPYVALVVLAIAAAERLRRRVRESRA